ncbi:hypothetical protein [Natronobacterium gregoryi]|uniref:CbaC protein n=2 Tax=Natronobacterium gregoryi TaxID=44930 RepID=L0AHU8_NATGS|nr:hypothetical protein [Natronobacterium gregoryi]AFZ73019.1 hypothetical protein Natgr_1828 [Natronobacterium gregoryi SP2]ELY64874.1 hypothetical protein C490_14350 [Natronobacterium gregoryi SP2]PLK18379.1 CbaC protein [Natronobacterium gregoryi SP2]SFJ71634.1 hypothetical protein SAMN05443661_16412 [Natronobacterium gregoryi]
MRVSKAGLMVLLAFVVPLTVELRTVLAWFNVELTVLESVLVGLAVIAAIVVWATRPPKDEPSAASQ